MRYIYTLAFLFYLISTSASDIDSLRQYLVVEYLFDTDTIYVTRKSLGTISDSGPVKLDGTLKGDSASFTEGISGRALFLIDSAQVTVGRSQAELNSPEFTLMSWVKPYSWGQDSKRVEITERTNVYWMNVRVDTWLFRTGIFDKFNRWWYLDGDIQIPLNKWTFTACTYDGNTLKSYINGRLTGEMTIGDSLVYDPDGRVLSVGSREPDPNVGGSNTPAAYWDGLIDEFRIFNKALNEEEILAFMTLNHNSIPAPKAPSDLIAEYKEPGRIKLSWNDNSDNESEFVIYYCEGERQWLQYKAVEADTTTFYFTGFTFGETYKFKIAAISEGGFSEFSNISSLQTLKNQKIKPLAVYHFEENVNDAFGSFHGHTMGNILYGEGKSGMGLALTSHSDGYVSIPYKNYDSFTLNLWIKTDTIAPGNPFYNPWNSGWGLLDGDLSGNGHDFGLAMLNSRIAFGTGKPDITIFSETEINDGAWHMLTAIMDTSSRLMRLYVDKIKEDSAYIEQNLHRSGLGRLFIGTSRTNLKYYKGYLDEISIYNKALSTEEIINLDDTELKNNEISTSKSLYIYPNPAKSFIYVNTDLTNNYLVYKMISASGKIVLQGITLKDIPINVSDLNPGIYILNISLGSETFLQKVIICK